VNTLTEFDEISFRSFARIGVCNLIYQRPVSAQTDPDPDIELPREAECDGNEGQFCTGSVFYEPRNWSVDRLDQLLVFGQLGRGGRFWKRDDEPALLPDGDNAAY
jgi:hypothetical protein